MPTRGDIEAATPHCQARGVGAAMHRNFGLLGGKVRSTTEVPCVRPLRYREATNTWICDCGSAHAGSSVAGRGAAFAPQAEAA